MEQEVWWLSKQVYNKFTAAYEINTKEPYSSHYYTGSIYLANWEWLVFRLSISEVKGAVISAVIDFLSRQDKDTVYLELYSGTGDVTYYNLTNNWRKHAWNGSTYTKSASLSINQRKTVDISGTGLYEAARTGNDVYIIVRPEGDARIEVSETHWAYVDISCERYNPYVDKMTPNGVNKYVNKDTTLDWYSMTDYAEQKSFELGWSSDGGVNWNTITKETSDSQISIPAYTFPEGTIKWRVRFTTNEDKTSEYAYAEFQCVKQIPSVSIISPNDVDLKNDVSYTFEWNYSGEDLVQGTYEIGWSPDSGTTWNTQTYESSETQHLFPAGSFPEGTIQWRVRASNSIGNFSNYSYGTFTCSARLPVVQIEFPIDINISKSTPQIYTWIYSGNELEQSEYEISWSSDEGATWNVVNGTGNNQYHVFPSGTFPVGTILWKIKVTNTEGYSSEYVSSQFKSVGKGNAPVIESVTQNAIPEITWSSEYQIAFEVQILKDNDMIFSSGFIGGEEKSYTPDIIMKNGAYVIRVRIMNSYGYISDFGTYGFVLDAVEPNSTAKLSLLTNSSYGAVLDCKNILGEGYILKICNGAETVVGKYNGKPIIDYETKSDNQYVYVLRDHVEGYKDASRAMFKPSFTGAILHDLKEPENFVNIRLNEDEYVSVDDQITKNTVYKNCIGRIYPIKETDNQRDEETQISGFLHFEECSILRELYEKDKTVIFRSKEQCFHADISEYKEKNYHNIGYIVQVTLRRIDEENGVITV